MHVDFKLKPKAKVQHCEQFPQIGFDSRQPCLLVPLSLGDIFFKLDGWEKKTWGQGWLALLEPYCHHEEVVLQKPKLLV